MNPTKETGSTILWRNHTIERKMEKEWRDGSFGNFIVWDDTDHFNIVCRECKRMMRVYSVTLENGSDPAFPCLHLYAYCESCHKNSQRKIYLNEGGDLDVLQTALVDANLMWLGEIAKDLKIL